MTNVYWIYDPITGYSKIGRSVAPLQRETTLLAQAPQIRLMWYWEDCPDDTEHKLHNIYTTSARRGEWFEISAKGMAAMILVMREYKRVLTEHYTTFPIHKEIALELDKMLCNNKRVTPPISEHGWYRMSLVDRVQHRRAMDCFNGGCNSKHGPERISCWTEEVEDKVVFEDGFTVQKADYKRYAYYEI